MWVRVQSGWIWPARKLATCEGRALNYLYSPYLYAPPTPQGWGSTAEHSARTMSLAHCESPAPRAASHVQVPKETSTGLGDVNTDDTLPALCMHAIEWRASHACTEAHESRKSWHDNPRHGVQRAARPAAAGEPQQGGNLAARHSRAHARAPISGRTAPKYHATTTEACGGGGDHSSSGRDRGGARDQRGPGQRRCARRGTAAAFQTCVAPCPPSRWSRWWE